MALQVKDAQPTWDQETVFQVRPCSVFDVSSRVNRSNQIRSFQEAKRIVNALYQHIIYNEFLPALLGEDSALAQKLRPLENGFRNSYKKTGLDPRITNEFTAAAFRAGHSMIPAHYE